MYIREIYRAKKLPVSYEIFPPKGELRVEELRGTLEALAGTEPDFISVTCSAGGSGNGKNTAALTGIIEREYGIPAVAHVTCVNSTRADVDGAIEDIRSQGISNVFALRGDKLPGSETRDFCYGAQLVRYLRERTDFCVGGGCYPEGHVECDDFDEDIRHLREKQDAGAEFFLSQLFFENTAFYRFIDRARAAGISAPIDAGIMPIMGKSQITRMVFLCGASLPSAVIRMVNKYENDPAALLQAGMEYAARQIVELAESGAASGIHIYTMNKPEVAKFERGALRDAGF